MALHNTIFEKSVFVDTGAFLALVKETDTFHRDAVTCANVIQERNIPTFVSNVTIIETHKRFLFEMGYSKALDFLNEIYSGAINILRVAEENEIEAKTIIEKFSDQKFSFADAVNFSIMKQHGIGKAFTFDAHYSTFGFEKIPPCF